VADWGIGYEVTGGLTENGFSITETGNWGLSIYTSEGTYVLAPPADAEQHPTPEDLPALPQPNEDNDPPGGPGDPQNTTNTEKDDDIPPLTGGPSGFEFEGQTYDDVWEAAVSTGNHVTSDGEITTSGHSGNNSS